MLSERQSRHAGAFLEVTPSGIDQRLTSQRGGECPRPIAGAAPLLEPLDEPLRLLMPAQRNERFDGVGCTRDDRRLNRSHLLEIGDDRFKVWDGSFGVAE